MSKHKTEEVYDDQMAPLVTQLIELSKEHGIPLFVHAGMIGPDGEEMGCCTKVPSSIPDLGSWNARYNRCVRIVQGVEPGPAMSIIVSDVAEEDKDS